MNYDLLSGIITKTDTVTFMYILGYGPQAFISSSGGP